MEMKHGRGETRMAMSGHEMSRKEREDMTVEHHKVTVWLPILTACFGIWLAAGPATVTYPPGY